MTSYVPIIEGYWESRDLGSSFCCGLYMRGVEWRWLCVRWYALDTIAARFALLGTMPVIFCFALVCTWSIFCSLWSAYHVFG
jgi:hypothetical protein